MRLLTRKPRLEEFEAAALPHLNDLYRTATRLLGDPSRADDVVQEAYLTAWRHFDRFETGTNCRAWLFRILLHCAHHYRRKWLNPREVRDAEERIGQLPANSPEISQSITDGEVLQALDAIPVDYRSVILLVDVEDFSYKDAAGILEVPIGTVMSRLNRGRRLLRAQLAALAQSYGLGRTHSEGMNA